MDQHNSILKQPKLKQLMATCIGQERLMVLGVDMLYFIAAATTCKAQMRIVQWVDKLVKRLNCAL